MASIRRVAVAFVAGLFAVAVAASEELPRPVDDRPEESSVQSAGVTRLAAEVAEIANSSSLSRAKKEKRISTAVRVATVVATTYKRDPQEILRAALEITEAAAQAAPNFADTIASSISFAAPIVRVDGAAGQIRAAAFAAAKAPHGQKVARTALSKSIQPGRTEAETPGTNRPSAETGPGSTKETRQAGFSESEISPSPNLPKSSSPKLSLGDNASIAVTANVGVRHDDNVYLTDAAKVGDTITSFTPGIEFSFGQNSLAHGVLAYQNSFTSYAEHTSPSVKLGNGSADFGYDNGVVVASGAATYQEVNQNSTGTAGPAGSFAYRRDVSGLNAGIETHLSAKTGVKVAAQIDRTKYRTAGLAGNESVSWPLNLYYQTTPKLDFSTGVTFTRVESDLGGPTSRDTYYNVGVRGELTPKLNANFSAGYRTRSVGEAPDEKLPGFTGSFDYELTPKTELVLALSRDFAVGTRGESLKSGSYSLQLSSSPNEQWQFSGNVTYRTDDYGATVFDPQNPTAPSTRQDRYWEAGIAATYAFSSWLSISADDTYRRNHTSVEALRFTNNIISLSLNLRY